MEGEDAFFVLDIPEFWRVSGGESHVEVVGTCGPIDEQSISGTDEVFEVLRVHCGGGDMFRVRFDFLR